MFQEFLDVFNTPAFQEVWRFVLKLSPLWITLVLVFIWFDLWLSYKRREWMKAQGSVLLEIRLPRDMMKSPVAMEVFLQNLAQTGVGSLIDVYLKGRVRPWFSLELVSSEGTVHFYIWMHKGYRNLIETQLYAQFPNIEIHEVPDYALGFQYDLSRYKIGKVSNIKLTKADAYPIKTYIDYGLHEDPKEEFKVDPMVPVLEFLGALKKGEHAWVQILLQGHTKEGLKYGRITAKPDWKKAAEAEIAKILSEGKLKSKEEKSVDPKFLSEAQKEAVKAIERSLDKVAFDSMIRVAYFAEKDSFNPSNIGGLLGVFKQFSSGNLNGLRPSWPSYDYPWQDIGGRKKKSEEQDFFEAYKRRSFFNEPFKHLEDEPYILTVEEVATLYHFPGTVAATPTLTRIPSKKAEAPANLPI